MSDEFSKSERCETCTFSSFPSFYSYGDAEISSTHVKCRRHAPVATGGMMSPAWTIWARVKPTDWCGDWRMK